MPASPPLFESKLESLKLLGRGKVRDIYEVDSRTLLIIATDRISAFDVVLPDPIPQKGRVLTAISTFWFAKLGHLIPNHLTGIEPAAVVQGEADLATVANRAVVVERLDPVPIEAVVRGYLIGSGWKDYLSSGSVCGIRLPKGLELAEQLKEPIFTPSTKAAMGSHDENIRTEDVEHLIGKEMTAMIRETALKLYEEAAQYASTRGIIIADTKFEFGLDESGKLKLMDEILTPDSSRFWPEASYHRGASPPSFDKQYVRDYLESLDWDKRPPAPKLPTIVIARTSEKYQEALQRLTG